jgi:hypothetical protein
MISQNLQASSCDVRLVGEVAFDWLSGSQAGKVLASVTQAIYLVGGTEELLWLAPESSPMHRRCLKIAAPLPFMQVGAGFRVRDGLLVTGTGPTLDFGRSPVWMEPVFPDGKLVPVGMLGGLVQSAYRQFTAQKESTGWGALIPAVLQMAWGYSAPEGSGAASFLPRNGWPSVKGILEACLAHDFGSVLQHATALVGLGAGLTPSGDDFLGGLFFSIQLLRRAYPEIPDLQTWNDSDFILECKPQTNLISFTLLKDHAQGHGLEPLHRFANSLLAGCPIDQCLPFVNELAGVGHSTGWDILTGFLVGMSVTLT